jgi:hypothetical protein
VKGIVLQCGKYGCVVRLEDGRLAKLPAAEAAQAGIRRVLAAKRRPVFPFVVMEEDGRLLLRLAPNDDARRETDVPLEQSLNPNVALEGSSSPNVALERSSRQPGADVSASTPLDQKIIEYLRQTADWDPNGAIASRAQESKQTRADRLLPFEARARRQYRDTPKKPPRKKR